MSLIHLVDSPRHPGIYFLQEGSLLKDALVEAKKLAKEEGRVVQVSWDGVVISVDAHTHIGQATAAAQEILVERRRAGREE